MLRSSIKLSTRASSALSIPSKALMQRSLSLAAAAASRAAPLPAADAARALRALTDSPLLASVVSARSFSTARLAAATSALAKTASASSSVATAAGAAARAKRFSSSTSAAAAAPAVKPPREYYNPAAPPAVAADGATVLPAGEVAVSLVQKDKAVATWLFLVAALVFVMVVLGGLTRLTKSGLSMVHWKFFGEQRPRTPEEWEAEFARYKESPEYKLHNQGMAVEDFKFIYMMEYGHRTLGRLIGLAFAVPFLGFVLARRLPVASPLTKLLAGAGALGGLQGLIGWWMVRSGLTEEDNKVRARVSPYRLATHLVSAFALFSLLTVGGLQAARGKSVRQLLNGLRARLPSAGSRLFAKTAHFTAGLAGLTAASGAFVAGNEAGLIYNEFPLMGGQVIPSDLINPYMSPAWRNIFEHPTFVQFTHRCLALSTATAATATLVLSRNAAHVAPGSEVRGAALLLGGAVAAQVGLGITTLLSHVHTHVAATHQAGALVVLAAAVNLVYKIKNPRVKTAVTAAAAAAAALVTVKQGPAAASPYAGSKAVEMEELRELAAAAASKGKYE